MIPEVEREALRNHKRVDLEGLQIHSRRLRSLVDVDARKFTLRRIHSIETVNAMVYIRQRNEDEEERRPVEYAEDLDELFRLTNNAFVERLWLRFNATNRTFPFYLRSRATELQCRIRILSVTHPIEDWVDYALLDFVGRILQPSGYEAWMNNHTPEERVTLFTRDSLRECITHLDYKFSTMPVPDYVIPELLHSRVVDQLLHLHRPAPLDRAIYYGVRSECTRSTQLPSSRSSTHAALQRHAVAGRRRPDPLRRPLRLEVPEPGGTFVSDWCPHTRGVEAATAKLYVYTHASAHKKINVHAWTVTSPSSLHYAYQLRISDV